MGHPSRTGPESYPHAFCACMTVQHTGTYFLGATLRELTDHCGTGWPATAVGAKGQRVGYRIQHLYGTGYSEAQQTGPGRDCAAFWHDWIVNTDLPIVVTLRHPQASMDTLWRRTGPHGVRGYGPAQHVQSFVRLALLIGGHAGIPASRVHAFRVDCEPPERRSELCGLLGHVMPDALQLYAPCVVSWSERWPVFNSRARRVVGDGEPPNPAPRVPHELVEALGYATVEV